MEVEANEVEAEESKVEIIPQINLGVGEEHLQVLERHNI